jgi:hypothetical protein
MHEKYPKFDREPDFAGLGRFSADGEALDDYECCFFLPAQDLAGMWVLIKAPILTENHYPGTPGRPSAIKLCPAWWLRLIAACAVETQRPSLNCS